MASPAILRACLDLMHFSGATAVGRKGFQGVGHIFCLHHVLPEGGRQKTFAPNSKLEIEPEFLASMIELVRRRGFETVSLGEAVTRLRNGAHGAKPFSVFTLDDGYKDNNEFARPVFDKLKCPYTIFVAPRIVEGTCEIWWRILEQLINAGLRFVAEIGGEQFDLPTRSDDEKNRAWTVLFPKFESLDQHEQRRVIRALAESRGIDVDGYCRSVAMGWEELREINRDPLCTLGAHTMNHLAVGKLNESDARFELTESRKIVTRELDEPTAFNAYPYGDEPNAKPRDFKLAEDAGYQASLTTRKGVIYAGHAHHLQALPRIMVSGRFQELRYIDAMISGLPTALSNRFSKVNVS
jgi:peptidoglycan/xylan/chitin deacetylase (PgdA/CDA1 family)